MRTGGDQRGQRTLEMLAGEGVAAVMRELADGSLRPRELERHLPELTHAGLMRCLERLSLGEVIARERLPGSPPHTEYTLTGRGRKLLEVVAAAASWERGRRLEGERAPGMWALKLIADDYVRAVLRTLADGPLGQGEIERRIPGLSHTTLTRRLDQLMSGGALVPQNAPGRRKFYELTPDGRRLGLVVVLAARWEGDGAARNDSVPAGDLVGLVHLIAPLAHVSSQMAGICLLRVNMGTSPGLDIHLATRSRKLTALPLAPTSPTHAQGDATAGEWCDALMLGDPTRVSVEGDRALLAAVLVALSAALRA